MEGERDIHTERNRQRRGRKHEYDVGCVGRWGGSGEGKEK